MDYAMEYALMSDIYDEMGGPYRLTPANEGFFGKIKRFFIGLLNAFIRKLEELVGIFKKKSNQGERGNEGLPKNDPSKKDQQTQTQKRPPQSHSSTTSKPFNVIKWEGEFTDENGKRWRRFVDENGNKAVMDVESEEKAKEKSEANRKFNEEQARKKIEEANKRAEAEAKAAYERKRKQREQEEREEEEKRAKDKRAKELLLQVDKLQDDYNRWFLSLKPKVNTMIDHVSSVITELRKVIGRCSVDTRNFLKYESIKVDSFSHATKNITNTISNFSKEIESDFSKLCQDCEPVSIEVDDLINVITEKTEEFLQKRDGLVQAGCDTQGLENAAKYHGAIGQIIEVLAPDRRKDLINKTYDAIISIKAAKKLFEDKNELYVGNSSNNRYNRLTSKDEYDEFNKASEASRLRENEVILKGLNKANTSFGYLESKVATLDKTRTYFLDRNKLHSLANKIRGDSLY